MTTKRKRRTTKRKNVALTPYNARRAKVGAFDTQSIMFAAVGGAAGGFLNKLIPDSWNLDPKIVSGGKIAIGAIMPNLAKDGKTKMMLQHMGEGLIAVGTYELLQNMGLINGLGEIKAKDDDLLVVTLEGIEDIEFEEVAQDVAEDLNVVQDDVLNQNPDLAVIQDDVLNG